MSGDAQIIIPAGYNLKIYIAGKFSMSGGSITNGTNRAANLSRYGIDPGDNSTPWQFGSSSDFTGTIYGPSIEFKVTAPLIFMVRH